MAEAIPPTCPYCGQPMHTVAMHCDGCQVDVRGRFRESLFHRLGTEDLEFLERYLLADFNIKRLAEETGMGYTAIRNRLDRIIALSRELSEGERQRKRILDLLAAQEITAAEAAKRLATIGR